MDLYIVHWANCEEIDEMGAECFASLDDAITFTEGMIDKNFSKDHNVTLPAYEIFIDEVIEPEMLFPYLYKITKKSITLTF